jgi:hypothetical protein
MPGERRDASLHQRLIDAVDRSSRAQERSHQLVELYAAIDARARVVMEELSARREQIHVARERARRSQSDR